MKNIFLLFAFLTQQNAFADMAWLPSVGIMCNEAEVIIEGKYLGKDLVQISKCYKGRTEESGTFYVRDLGLHLKIKGVDNVILFLERADSRGKINENIAYSPIGIYPAATTSYSNVPGGKIGSAGVIWFNDTCCLKYAQLMNPGGLSLGKAYRDFYNIEYSIEAVRQDIKTGLEESIKWENAVALKDTNEKVKVFSDFLLNSTTPCSGNYYYYAHHAAFQAFWSLHPRLFPPYLCTQLEKADTSDNLQEIVRILALNGSAATRPAINQLCQLLSLKKERAPASWIIDALEKTRDEKAIPCIRTQLYCDKDYLRVDAAIALCRLNDQEYYEKIELVLLKNYTDYYDENYIEQLRALYLLNPTRSRPAIEKIAVAHDKDYEGRTYGKDYRRNDISSILNEELPGK